MTTDAFHKALKAEPFQPFVLHMANGRRHAVRHRDFVARSKSGRTVAIFDDDGDGASVLDLLLMTEIQMLPTPADQAA